MMRSWLKWWRNPKPRTPARRARRLSVEGLEDRAVPATFTVNMRADVVDATDSRLSLREAITRANAHPGADTIVLPTGVCGIALGAAGEDGNEIGDFDILDTVTIQGAGAGVSIVQGFTDGVHFDRVFDVHGSIRAVFQGLTIRGGNTTLNGGGVRSEDANLVLRNIVVTGNRAGGAGGGIASSTGVGTTVVRLDHSTVSRNVSNASGGGLWVVAGSSLNATDSTIRRNIAAENGGGVHVDPDSATALFDGTTVSGNRAGENGGGIWAYKVNLTGSRIIANSSALAGGGMYVSSPISTAATVAGSTVSSNTAGASGGGLHVAGTLTFTDGALRSNTAGSFGGGIYAGAVTLNRGAVSGNSAVSFGGGMNATTMTVTSSTVSGNSAGSDGGGLIAATATVNRSLLSGNSSGLHGGGIYAGTATMTNNTVSGNTAASNGGGVWAGTAALLNCTVVENVAHSGGGLHHEAGGTFSLRNTIVALNLVDFSGTNRDVSGSFTSLGHNLIGDGTGGTGFTHGVNGDIVGTGASPIDPKIGALRNNGGPTKTHALLAGSPAIDRGDNTDVPGSDQRGPGFPRRKDGNGDGIAIVDIGAFEL